MDWFLCNKCIAAFSQNGKFVITRCGHIFCGKCVADATTCPECNAPLATLLIHKQMKSGREFFVQGNNAVATALQNLQMALKVDDFRNKQAKLALKKLYRKAQSTQPHHHPQHQHHQQPYSLQSAKVHPHPTPQHSQRLPLPHQQATPSTMTTPNRPLFSNERRLSTTPRSARLSIRRSPAVLRQQQQQQYNHARPAETPMVKRNVRPPLPKNSSPSLQSTPISSTITSRVRNANVATMQINPDGTPLSKKRHSASSSFTTPAFHRTHHTRK
eukprot:m.193238 g.193238  ORF g.193238 m.193238 type:complete len:272 (-) comp13655_c2_seq12:170-985(-)